MSVIREAANVLGMHLAVVNCYGMSFSGNNGTNGVVTDLRKVVNEAKDCSPSILVLRNISAIEQSTSSASSPEKKDALIAAILRENLDAESFNMGKFPVVVVATVDKVSLLGSPLRSWFRHELSLQAPDNTARQQILHQLFQGVSLSPDVSLRTLAQRTASFLPSDLSSLVSSTSLFTIKFKCLVFRFLKHVSLLLAVC
jgi:peroxin-6